VTVVSSTPALIQPRGAGRHGPAKGAPALPRIHPCGAPSAWQGLREAPLRGAPGQSAGSGAGSFGVLRRKAMVSSFLCCPIRQVVVHVYPGQEKAGCSARITMPIGRRGRPVSKPRFMPLRRAQAIARQLQAHRIGTVSVL